MLGLSGGQAYREAGLNPIWRVVEGGERGGFSRFDSGREINQAAHFGNRLNVIFKGGISNRAFLGMGGGPAFLGSDDLIGHGFLTSGPVTNI